MDIAAYLLNANSRKAWDVVANYIGDDPERFSVFMNGFLGDDVKLVKASGQVFGSIVEKRPHLLPPYFGKVIANLSKHPIPMVKRNVMRILQWVTIPEEYETDLLDIGFAYLQDAEEAIAIKAFTMTVLRRICERYPELANELILQIEIIVNANLSAGLTNRGQHELKKLNKIKAKLG